MIKGAIFDLDGVIVNTVPFHFKAWQRMFESYGHSFSQQDYFDRVDGKPRLDGCKAILTDLSDAELQVACDKKQSYFSELLDNEKVIIFQGTISLIKECLAANIKLAVASSSKNTLRILKSVEAAYDIPVLSWFDTIVTGNDFKIGKPNPEIFLTAATRISESPDYCIVFEDAVAGVQAAKAGGFFCVGIDRHDNPALLNEADLIVKDLEDISLDIIKAKKGKN